MRQASKAGGGSNVSHACAGLRLIVMKRTYEKMEGKEVRKGRPSPCTYAVSPQLLTSQLRKQCRNTARHAFFSDLDHVSEMLLIGASAVTSTV